MILMASSTSSSAASNAMDGDKRVQPDLADFVVDDVFRVVVTDVEDAFPEAPVGVDFQKTFTECDKNGDVEERVWGQLVQLDPVDKKEATKKFMNRNGEAVNEEIDKNYLKTGRRMGRTLIPGHLHGLLVEHAHPLEQAIVLRGDFRPLPSGDLALLHALLRARGTVLVVLGARSHGRSTVKK
jgi:hypothetical protein